MNRESQSEAVRLYGYCCTGTVPKSISRKSHTTTVRIFMWAGGWVGQLASLHGCMSEHKNLVGGGWSEFPESQYKYF